jgi:hypothetical protein
LIADWGLQAFLVEMLRRIPLLDNGGEESKQIVMGNQKIE